MLSGLEQVLVWDGDPCWFCVSVCRPIPKHLHTPGNNGRYSTIQCRISHSALTSLLRDWSSFVLVEGYSYVKLIYRYDHIRRSTTNVFNKNK